MSKKPGTLTKKEAYSLHVQDLMDAISVSSVAKHVKQIDDYRRSITWVLDGYTVYSGAHNVYSIGLNDTQHFEFSLKTEDYKNFVQACEKRRAELREQAKAKKR